LVSELTLTGEVAPLLDSVAPPSLDVQVAVKPVMVLPPVLPAVNATDTLLSPGVVDVIVGAPGRTAATNELDDADGDPAPTTLMDSAVQVYVSPLVSELTVTGELAPLLDSVAPPSLDVQVTVLFVMALPPSEPGVKATVTALRPRVIPLTVGAAGTDTATKLLETADAGPFPMTLVA
jgi:hypothetical protein